MAVVKPNPLARAGLRDGLEQQWRHWDKSSIVWLLAIVILAFLVVNPLLRLFVVSFQDDTGAFTRVNGPVMEMLGLRVAPPAEPVPTDLAGLLGRGWDNAERAALQARIEDRQPFLDFLFHRTRDDGSRQQFRVSGEPMFNQACRFLGYRGIGVELTSSPANQLAGGEHGGAA